MEQEEPSGHILKMAKTKYDYRVIEYRKVGQPGAKFKKKYFTSEKKSRIFANRLYDNGRGGYSVVSSLYKPRKSIAKPNMIKRYRK